MLVARSTSNTTQTDSDKPSGTNGYDARALAAAGVTRAQIDDALAVCWAFNVINRLADTFAFDVPGPEAFAASAKMLLSRGYK